ncbi:hypothetical protein [Actinomadura sp. DC4]|uniref:carboxypeptidase-like regulatory domain-containing protein n=1 Tax=Actinomadura sp. DC4 TaxID=3055069 RepID=UPI0025AFB06A|nr:hypothetical protein [Actinomadura sp. DC4]MDN3356363.1 hypothetical protein [Actinomadura sp. DC4]
MAAVVLALGPAQVAARPVAHAAAGGHPKLTVSAPRTTRSGSVTVRGRTAVRSVVTVSGGVLPAMAVTGRDGTFAVEVGLRPGRRNHLTVRASSGGRRPARRVTVEQRPGKARGRATGRVLDAATRRPVAVATASYGTRTARSGGDGRYTLTGLPDGRLTIAVRAPGRLDGLTAAVLSGGRGQAADASVQRRAAPVRVGPRGGSYSGKGWRVTVPAGAVRKRTGLNLTPLAVTGMKDAFGTGVLDLSPDGLRFARPITVAVDPGAFGRDPARTVIRGLDSGRLTVTTPRTRVVGKEMVFRLDRLGGLEVRADLPETSSGDGAFDIMVRYRRPRWESGDLSGGRGGLGGTSAAVGYTNGSGEPGTFLEVPGSRTPGSFLDTAPNDLAHTSTGSDQTGVHVYPIRS